MQVLSEQVKNKLLFQLLVKALSVLWVMQTYQGQL